jgi:virginiamycin B lyase
MAVARSLSSRATGNKPVVSRSPAPTISEITVVDERAGRYGIAAGPDGALWLTLVHGGATARLTLDGALQII